MKKKKAHIIGMGIYLPEKVLTNQELEKRVDTTDEWIVSRSGIRERRIANEDETAAFMGYRSALGAIEEAGLKPDEIDLIIAATMTPDYLCPTTSTQVQSFFKLECPAFDVQAACSGYLYALNQAQALVEAGLYQNVLVVATEKMSAFIDYEDRNTCVLFGDGAASAVVSLKEKGYRVEGVYLGADGTQGELIVIPAGGGKKPTTIETVKNREHFLKMQGKEVFKQAVKKMGHSIEKVLSQVGVSEKEISWLIPHQANLRIIETLAKLFHLSPEKVYVTLQKYGNTSASSVGIALYELDKEKDVKAGECLLLVAFGAGSTWGSAVIRKVKHDKI